MSTKKDVSRRDFMRNAARVAAGITVGAGAVHTAKADVYKRILPASVLGANEMIRTGHIGVGAMGTANLRFAMQRDDMMPIAVCDLYLPRRKRAQQNARAKNPNATDHHDYREVIDNKDVDAVVISTPDHWHAMTAIAACNAGKAVYCEKPVATTVEEGQKMLEAARRNNTVFQCGTMQRSGQTFQEAVELVRSGHIGKVARVETWYADGLAIEGIGDPPDGDPPQYCDWEFHQGWVEHKPFNENRWLYNFRWFWDYAGGKVTDWGVHLVDIALWGMGGDPKFKTVTAQGGKYIVTDNRTTPDTIEVLWEFDDYILSFSNRVYTSFPNAGGREHGIAFHGHLGTLRVDRNGYDVIPCSNKTISEETAPSCEPREARATAESNPAHWQNFADCIRSGERPICDIEVCHNTTTVCHAGNAAFLARAQLTWDAANERFTGEPAAAVEQANAFMYRPYQNGYSLA